MPWLSWKCSLFSPPLTKDSRKDGKKYWLGQEVTSAGGTSMTHALDPSVFPVCGESPAGLSRIFPGWMSCHPPNHLFKCLGLREKIYTLLLHHFRSLFSPQGLVPIGEPLCRKQRRQGTQTQFEVPQIPTSPRSSASCVVD